MPDYAKKINPVLGWQYINNSITLVILISEQHNTATIVLRPNRSINWRQVKLILLLLAIPVTIIAAGWWMAGIWIILPFAGFELLLLSVLMYRVNWQLYQQQVITISADTLVIEEGYHSLERYIFTRANCYISVTETQRHWQLPLVYLHHHSDEVALGHFLNLRERRDLKQILHDHGLKICRNRWWQD